MPAQTTGLGTSFRKSASRRLDSAPPNTVAVVSRPVMPSIFLLTSSITAAFSQSMSLRRGEDL